MKDINKIFQDYQKELSSLNQELTELPVGRLVKRGNYYWQIIDKKEFGITNNPDQIKKLGRKHYVATRIKILNQFLKQRTNKLTVKTPTETIKSFSTTYQGLPISNFYHPKVVDWLVKPFRENPYQRENLQYQSKKGTIVRSKSEVMIANMLEDYEIPYRYEIAMKIGGQIKYPDFVIMQPFTGELIVWEHFGLANQIEYAEKMNERMKLYLKQGYKPFENLIYTFEFDLINGEQRLRDLIENVIL